MRMVVGIMRNRRSDPVFVIPAVAFLVRYSKNM
jgi:hypothetical protein